MPIGISDKSDGDHSDKSDAFRTQIGHKSDTEGQMGCCDARMKLTERLLLAGGDGLLGGDRWRSSGQYALFSDKERGNTYDVM